MWISIYLDAFVHFQEKHDMRTKEGARRQALENCYHLYRVPSCLKSSDSMRLLTFYNASERASSYFNRDFFSDISLLIARNLIALAPKKSSLMEDFDAVLPRKAAQQVKIPQQPAVTVIAEHPATVSEFATTIAEASNAA